MVVSHHGLARIVSAAPQSSILHDNPGWALPASNLLYWCYSHFQAARLPLVGLPVAAKVPLVAELAYAAAKLNSPLLTSSCFWQTQGRQQMAQDALVTFTCMPCTHHNRSNQDVVTTK